MVDINKEIETVVRTGKVLFGANNAIKNSRSGRARLIILSTNCQKRVYEDIEYYCKLSDIPVIIFDGTSVDLGITCRKPFMVSALTIRDPGDSEILKNLEAEND